MNRLFLFASLVCFSRSYRWYAFPSSFKNRHFVPRLATRVPRLPRLSVGENSFAEIIPSLPLTVLEALASRNVHEPTAIQKASMGRIYKGKEDLVLHAETGSGKTFAFLLPTLARLGYAGKMETYKDAKKVLIMAPTRELAVQLANDAALVVPAPGAVQVIAVGAIPKPDALRRAVVVTCTADVLLELMNSETTAGPVDAFLRNIRVIVLDEMDRLLQMKKVYGQNADRKKRRLYDRKEAKHITEVALAEVLVYAISPDLQILAASATASRPTRLKLARILRREALGRWAEKEPAMVRAEDSSEDLTKAPLAVVIPHGVKHYYIRLPSNVTLRRLNAEDAAPKDATWERKTEKLTLKEKRAKKDFEERKKKREVAKKGHPMFVTLALAIKKIKPPSAIVFLCRSSGLTVGSAVRELRELGLNATALHIAIGLGTKKDAPASTKRHRFDGLRGKDTEVEEEDPIELLKKSHQEISRKFSERQGSIAGSTEDSTLVVTFEDMARGLHFDAVDTVFILGMPDSPATYLHLAGRTGRQPVLEGRVVTICPKSTHSQLLGWSSRLGGIQIEEIDLDKQVSDELGDLVGSRMQIPSGEQLDGGEIEALGYDVRSEIDSPIEEQIAQDEQEIDSPTQDKLELDEQEHDEAAVDFRGEIDSPFDEYVEQKEPERAELEKDVSGEISSSTQETLELDGQERDELALDVPSPVNTLKEDQLELHEAPTEVGAREEHIELAEAESDEIHKVVMNTPSEIGARVARIEQVKSDPREVAAAEGHIEHIKEDNGKVGHDVRRQMNAAKQIGTFGYDPDRGF